MHLQASALKKMTVFFCSHFIIHVLNEVTKNEEVKFLFLFSGFDACFEFFYALFLSVCFCVSFSSFVCFVFQLWVPAVYFRVHFSCFGCFVFEFIFPVLGALFSTSLFLFWVLRFQVLLCFVFEFIFPFLGASFRVLGAWILFSSSGCFLHSSSV